MASRNYNLVGLPSKNLPNTPHPRRSEGGETVVQPVQSRAPGQALAEALPPLTDQEAMVEAHRCLFCYD
ncbi:MAG: hypothetical protein JO185_23225, partial [Acidobacteriaceae bacterium]|nr:hypothetical protein [Acidobacteriaceae bacterium]